jgi:hypothetical protein
MSLSAARPFAASGVGVHLVEGEVLEVLDQLGVGLGEGGDAVAEQLAVIALRGRR